MKKKLLLLILLLSFSLFAEKAKYDPQSNDYASLSITYPFMLKLEIGRIRYETFQISLFSYGTNFNNVTYSDYDEMDDSVGYRYYMSICAIGAKKSLSPSHDKEIGYFVAPLSIMSVTKEYKLDDGYIASRNVGGFFNVSIYYRQNFTFGHFEVGAHAPLIWFEFSDNGNYNTDPDPYEFNFPIEFPGFLYVSFGI